jgi:hypothetical protein
VSTAAVTSSPHPPATPLLIEKAGFAPTGAMGDATSKSVFTIDNQSTDHGRWVWTEAEPEETAG